jgi:glyoxylase-like metal-dependent hydrolase (beta-lactamase superfamily II)
MTVGFVGVGRMGSRMARRVLAAGFTVRVFDRSSDVMRAAVATGAQPTATAAALAAASDVVVSVLPDAEAVEAAIEGADGIAAGVRPEEIDVLILTHLHGDHASSLHLFPRARVLVQRDELRYAVAPLAPHRWAYESYPPLGLAADRFEVLDGDAEIAEGVSVHLTPGHPPGLQGVAVRTA